MGIRTDSVIMTDNLADNLATVLEREIDQVIGNCPILDQLDSYGHRTIASRFPTPFNRDVYLAAIHIRINDFLAWFRFTISSASY
jgi:hypothetical protein